MNQLTALVSALLVAVGALMPLAAGTASAEATNLIANPGFETAAGSVPASWTSNTWGTNTSKFTYDTTGRSGSRAASVAVSGYKSGDAKWSFAPVAVTPGKTYTFSNWYKSGVATGLDAVVTTASGATSYHWIASPAASTTWKQQTYTFVAPANAKTLTFYHYIMKNGTLSVDDYSLSDGSTTTPPANTAPTVSLTAPAANATVANTANVAANAADDKGVASVQFKLDGNNLGAADATAPYSVAWDTKATTNGKHNLTAVATDSNGVQTTSAAVAVTVNNAVTPPVSTNLISNPSVETAGNGAPTGWTKNAWGTNTSALTYESSGQDGTKSVKTTISKYTDGDAKWYFNPIAVTPGQTYAYNEYYKSSVDAEVDAMVTMNDGSVQYYYLGTTVASPNAWTKVNMQFTAPANAKNVTIMHVLAKAGYVQSDNFNFSKYTPAQLDRPLVSLTFDDGWRSIYANGAPLLQKYGMASTQYLNSEPVSGNYADYMTYDMVKDWKAKGHELAWHTRSHADVTTLTAGNLLTELTLPQDFLSGTGTVANEWKNFATPYGSYNASSVATIMENFQSHRSTDVGYNSKDALDLTNVKVQNITNTTTPADVQTWVNQAIATKTWLVIVYHEVDAGAQDPTYAVTPANLDSELSIVQQSGITVKTVEQAIAEIKSQL